MKKKTIQAPFIEGTKVLLSEYQCSCCGELPVDFLSDIDEGSGAPMIAYEYSLLFAIYDDIIDEFGRRIPISSGYRCRKKQSTFSVHSFGLALDLDVNNKDEVMRVVKIARKHRLAPRIGWQKYLDCGQTFVHIDIGYLIYPRWSKSLERGVEW